MILFLICVLLLVISSILFYKADIFGIITILASISLFFMIIFIGITQICANSDNLKNIEKYNTLIYKTESSAYKDDFGLINNEVINEIEQWNEDYVSYKHYSENPFTNIFCLKRVIKNVDKINIEQIF